MRAVDRAFLFACAVAVLFIVASLVQSGIGIYKHFASPPDPEPVVIVDGWHRGSLPVGRPVVGLYLLDGGGIATVPLLQTDYAGLYEYRGGADNWPAERHPDWWCIMPEGEP